MGLVTGGLLGPTLITRGLVGSVAFTFRRALRTKLLSIDTLAALVGGAIYPGAVPGTHDLATQGPALTFNVFKFFSGGLHSTHPGHNLSGSDGTVLARVRFGAWSYLYSQADAITAAVYAAIEGATEVTWDNVVIMSCIHSQELDSTEPGLQPKTIIYHIISEYDVRYRIAVPVRP